MASALASGCCCDDGGDGTVGPLCDTFTDCIAAGSYSGLRIVSASATGSHFDPEIPSGLRWNDDFTLSVGSVAEISRSVRDCTAFPPFSRALVNYSADLVLSVAASACTSRTCVLTTPTTATATGSLYLGCQCSTPFGIVSHGDLGGAIWDYLGQPFPGACRYAAGWGYLVSSTIPGQVVAGCGSLSGVHEFVFGVRTATSSVSPVSCAGDLTTTPPPSPFRLSIVVDLAP